MNLLEKFTNKQIALLLFISLLISYAFITHRKHSGWNDASRLALVQSLVDHQSFSIDKSNYRYTGDKYRYNRKYYSDKPPTLSFFAGGAYFLFNKLFGLNLQKDRRTTSYLLFLICSGLISSLGFMFYFLFATRKFNIPPPLALLTTIIAAFCTINFCYNGVLNNHTFSFGLLMIAIYLSTCLNKIFLAGVIYTLALTSDLAIIFFLPYFLLDGNKSLKIILQFFIGCALILGCYFAFILVTSGSIIPPALNPSLWDFPGSIKHQEKLTGHSINTGFFLLKYTTVSLIGNRGLFSHNPILLFTLCGLFFYKNKITNYHLIKTLLISSTAFIIFYLLTSQNYSGASYSIRWFATITPFLALPLVQLKSELMNAKIFSFLFVLTSYLSFLSQWVASHNPFTLLTDKFQLIAIPIEFINKKSHKILSYPIFTLFFGSMILLYVFWAYQFTQEKNVKKYSKK